MNIDTLTLESARKGDLEAVKNWVKEGGSVHLALIGGSDHGHTEVCNWALDNGACLLFDIPHPKIDKEDACWKEITIVRTDSKLLLTNKGKI